jgi:hypothetical protein
MLRRTALVGIEVTGKHIASIIRVTRVGELGTSAVTSNRRTLRRSTDISGEYIAAIIMVIEIGEIKTLAVNNILIDFLRLLVIANAVLISQILVTLMMKAIRSSETSVLTRPSRRNIPEDDVLHLSCLVASVLDLMAMRLTGD